MLVDFLLEDTNKSGWCIVNRGRIFVSVEIQLDIAMLSDRGRWRKGNEDACGYDFNAGVFVVCDGMGGAAAGEVASHLAVETFLHYASETNRHGVTRAQNEQPEKFLTEAINHANHAVYQRARKEQELRGMGTTLIALLLKQGPESNLLAWIAHAGDSRCYRLRADTLEALTFDHSLVEEQVRMGRLTQEQAERSPLRNVITRAVGSGPQVEAEMGHAEIVPGDLYLLCSDGLTRELEDAEIAEVLLSTANLEAACAALVAKANEKGGRDNITVMLVRIH